MTPLIAGFVAQMAGTLAQALIDRHAPDLDEKMGELIRTGLLAKSEIEKLDGDARKAFLDALETVMAAARARIKQRVENR